jgi:protein SCO1
MVGLAVVGSLGGCEVESSEPVVAASTAAPSDSAPAPAAPQPTVQAFEQPQQLSSEPSMTTPTQLELPDVTLIDQTGKSVRLHDLLDGKVAVIQTMFTTCGTICPPLGTNFGRLQELLVDMPDVVLVSISVDPITDTPERMRAWGEKFGAGPKWTLLTGESGDIRKTLEALRVYSADREGHSSMVVIGEHRSGRWTRVDGLSEPSTLVSSIAKLRASEPIGAGGPPADNEAAHHYFTDIELVDHLGRPQRLYTDLLRGKIVLVNSFFTSCAGVCPPMTQRIAELQAPLADRLGKDVFFLSLTVDPVTDTTEALAAYAEKFGAKDGWLFLGGNKRNVDFALRKLGFAVEVREAHSNVLVIGNEPTGLWKKAFSMATPEDLLVVVRSVIDDAGPTPTAAQP